MREGLGGGNGTFSAPSWRSLVREAPPTVKRVRAEMQKVADVRGPPPHLKLPEGSVLVKLADTFFFFIFFIGTFMLHLSD